MSEIVRPGIAERLAELIRIPTVSATRDESDAATWQAFEDQFRAAYPLLHERLELLRPSDEGLLFHWAGSDSSLAGQPLVLMGHYDVVPVDESDAWTYPPFAGQIASGRVWGRGCLDDKGALVTLCEAVENLLASGYTPDRDIWLALGGNEEVYGTAGQAHAKYFRDQQLIPYLVLDEGGAVIDAPLSWVKLPAAMIGVGEKGILTVRLVAHGEGGHASAPNGLTATARIARAIGRLHPTSFPARVPPALRSMLAGFIPHTSGAPRWLLQLLTSATPLTAQVFARLGGEPAALVHTTVAVTKLDGGTADNVLPSQASATLNLRIALGETVSGTLIRLRRILRDPKIAIEVVDGYEPSPESPVSGEAFEAIRGAVAASYPQAVTTPYVVMAATDSRHFHRFSPAVYRFAPLAMDAAQRATVHGVDESVEIASLEQGVRFYHHLILTTCGKNFDD